MDEEETLGRVTVADRHEQLYSGALFWEETLSFALVQPLSAQSHELGKKPDGGEWSANAEGSNVTLAWCWQMYPLGQSQEKQQGPVWSTASQRWDLSHCPQVKEVDLNSASLLSTLSTTATMFVSTWRFETEFFVFYSVVSTDCGWNHGPHRKKFICVVLLKCSSKTPLSLLFATFLWVTAGVQNILHSHQPQLWNAGTQMESYVGKSSKH